MGAERSKTEGRGPAAERGTTGAPAGGTSLAPEDARATDAAGRSRREAGGGARPSLGDVIPDFTLPSAAGGEWRLGGALATGPVMVVFFRGAWCFLSRRVLASIRQRQPLFAEWDCTVVAIAMEPAARLAPLARKLKAPFPILSDPEARVVALFGVPIERKHACPFPAVFLVDAGGELRERHIGRDARDWPDADDLARPR